MTVVFGIAAARLSAGKILSVQRWRSLILSLGFLVLLSACTDTQSTDDVPAEETATRELPTYRMGLDSQHLSRAVERAEELPRTHNLLVARHGEIQFEHHFAGPGPAQAVNVKSVSKSILSALVGIAIDEGYLDGPDQPIGPFFEQYLNEDDDPRKREITVGNLLSMQSGLERTSGGNYGAWVSSSNWVRYKLNQPLRSDPGSSRSYSTGNTHLASAVLTEATGQSTWAFAREHLAEPLGIRLPQWPADPQGIYFGGNDMMISPRDLVRFGELYRKGGYLNGQRIIPHTWIRDSFIPKANSRWSGAGYGYGWFSSLIGDHPAYYGWGYGGQYLYIIPGLELTVVITSDPYSAGGRSHRAELRRIVEEEIVPAAEKGGEMIAEIQKGD